MLSNPSRDSHYSPVGKQNWCNWEAFLQNNSCQYYTSQQAQSLIKGYKGEIEAHQSIPKQAFLAGCRGRCLSKNINPDIFFRGRARQ